MMASENGHTATVKLLLEAGANKEAEDVVKMMRENHTHSHTPLAWLFGGDTMVSLHEVIDWGQYK